VVVQDTANAFVEHNLLTYAAAVSFQAIVALIPLALLTLALLGAFGLGHVWADTLAPALHGRVTQPVYHGIAFTARRIVSSGTAATTLFAGLLSAWYLTGAVRAVIEALNRIYDVKDECPWQRRALVGSRLGVTMGVALVGSFVLVAWGSTAGGPAAVVVDVARWLLAVALLGLAVALLVRLAPAEHPAQRWASAGSVLVVGTWILASLAFRRWITTVVDFKSPVGSLAGLLALAGYLFTCSAIFLVGVQLDETLRKLTGGRARGVLRWLYGASGPAGRAH
jgi:membrane protein